MNKVKLLLFVIGLFVTNALVLSAVAQKRNQSPQKFHSLRPGLPLVPHFLAKSSYSAAASVQAAGAAPRGTAQRNGDFPSGRPRTAAYRWHHPHPRRIRVKEPAEKVGMIAIYADVWRTGGTKSRRVTNWTTSWKPTAAPG